MRNIEINFTGQVVEDPSPARSVAGFRTTNFVVRHIPTFYNNKTDQWTDAEETDFICIAWKDLAEKIVENIHAGDYVMVSGEYRTRKVFDEDGTVVDVVAELVVRDIGKSLVYS